MRDAGYRTCYVGKWHTAGRPSSVGYSECDGLYGSGKAGAEPYVDFRGRKATGYGGWQFQMDDGRRFPRRAAFSAQAPLSAPRHAPQCP